MFKIVVLVSALLGGQPFGDPTEFTSRERYATQAECEAARERDVPGLVTALEAATGGVKGEAFTFLRNECVQEKLQSASAPGGPAEGGQGASLLYDPNEAALDLLQAVFRSMNLRGGIGSIQP